MRVFKKSSMFSKQFEQMIIWEQLGRVTNDLSWCFSEAQDWMEDNFNDFQKRKEKNYI